VGYDQDGRPAVVLRSKYRYDMQSLPDLLSEKDILSIVQATECLASKGQWWDRPIEVIWDDHSPAAHYTGTRIEMAK
jgi:hypothetical protein